MNKIKISLIIITLLAFVIRGYNLNFPPLLWDEAALGYNAYSIIKTGADEYGQKFPLIFKSFGDYKPGLYVYLAAPFIADLGLNNISVRLPSVILGSLLPLFIYLLIVSVSPNSKKLGLLAALICTFNPFNIHFSRGAWETNILTFELVLAAYFFFKHRYFWSSVIFALSLYTYQGAKLISLFLIIILFITNYKTILNSKLKMTLFIFPLLIAVIPIITGLLTQNTGNRLQVFNLWSYPRSQADTQQIIAEGGWLDYQIFHNQFFFFLSGVATRYFNHFSPKFLLFEGDWQDARSSAPYIGVILYPSLIFLIIGFFKSFFNLKNKPALNLFFLLWLLLAPIPAALTRDSLSSVRAMSLSVPLVYFIALGLLTVIEKYRSKILYLGIFTVYFLSFFYYADLYLNHMSKIKPEDWLYGYKQAIDYTLSHDKDKTVTFTDFYGQPYIYYLFYSSYPPSKYQPQSKLIVNGLDVGKINQIDNLKFSTPDFQGLKTKSNQLMIFSYDDAVRQGIDLKILTPLSPVGSISTFYAYETD